MFQTLAANSLFRADLRSEHEEIQVLAYLGAQSPEVLTLDEVKAVCGYLLSKLDGEQVTVNGQAERMRSSMTEKDLERAVAAAQKSGLETPEDIAEFVADWFRPMIHLERGANQADLGEGRLSMKLMIARPCGPVH